MKSSCPVPEKAIAVIEAYILSGWAEIARTFYRNNQLFNIFVVLHKTDSLAYTCFLLSFML